MNRGLRLAVVILAAWSVFNSGVRAESNGISDSDMTYAEAVPDMGGMTGRSPWAESHGCSAARAAAAGAGAGGSAPGLRGCAGGRGAAPDPPPSPLRHPAMRDRMCD